MTSQSTVLVSTIFSFSVNTWIIALVKVGSPPLGYFSRTPQVKSSVTNVPRIMSRVPAGLEYSLPARWWVIQFKVHCNTCFSRLFPNTHSSSSGALRSRCQEGIRYAEDLFGETVLKDKAEREQEAVGRASEQTLGLIPVKGDEGKSFS